VSWVRENRTPSSTGGRWKRGDPVGHPRVPGRCAEKRHHDGLVGTQPTDQSLPRQRSTLLTFAPRSATNKEGYSKGSVWSRLVNACGLSM